MHIECTIKRAGGSKITIERTEYHFAPQDDGAHVALVENDAHEARFLSIPEAYRLYKGECKPAGSAIEITTPAPAAASVEPTAPAAPPAPALLSTQHPDSFTIHGATHALTDIAALARAANGLSDADWSELSDEGRADLIDAELDKLEAAGPQAPAEQTDEQAAEREQLVQAHIAKFGVAPRANIGIDTLKKKLAE